ncbi:MAG: transglutaminase domain-containing protein [Candidatus Fimenecus sp.]
MKKLLSVVVALVICAVMFSLASRIDLGENTKSSIKENLQDIFSGDKVESTTDAFDFQAEFGGKTMYYYNNLDENLKEHYLTLYERVKNFEPYCNLKLSQDNADKVYMAIYFDNPELFWMDGNYKYTQTKSSVNITLEYKNTKEEADALTLSLNKKVNELIAESQKYSTEYEKEKFFHDYICLNTVYDESTLGNFGGTAYYPLLNGKAICEGYAKAMQILLDRAGIENYLIVGDATSDGSTEAHMWNIVNINGKNYHLDVTWDDSDDTDEISYLYFNVTDDDILYDHSKLVPENNNCIYTDDNYFVKSNRYLYSFNGYDELTTVTAEALKSGRNYIEFRFDKKSDYNRAVSVLENDNKFFSFVRNSVKKSGRKLAVNNIEYINVDNLNYICLLFVEE